MKQEIPPQVNKKPKKEIVESRHGNSDNNKFEKEFILEMQSFKDSPERHLLSQERVDEMLELFLNSIYVNRDHPEEYHDEQTLGVNWWSLSHPKYNKEAKESLDFFKSLLNTSDYEYDHQNNSFAEKCLKSCIEKEKRLPYESMITADLIINSTDWINDRLDVADEIEADIRPSFLLDLDIISRQKNDSPGYIVDILDDKLVEILYGASSDSDEHYDDYENESDELIWTKSGTDEYDLVNSFKKYLNFDDKTNFSRASAVLLLINDLARFSRKGMITDYNDNDILKNLLDDCTSHRSGNYLLNLRAMRYRDVIKSEGFEFSEETGVPFLVGHKSYAVRFYSGVYLSEPEDFVEISKMLKDYKRQSLDDD
ncbi:MAG: hypothetical protein GXO85_11340, partial [Chlorobi bacterium]|nr:hypothetical protein [Chlorobiota bacterium]